MAESYGELVIELHRSHAENYDVELWVSDSGSAGETAPVRGQASISLPALARLNQKPAEYGKELTATLLEGKEVRDFYVFHRRAFATREMGLRVRLLIGSGVPELQCLRWELLVDPETGNPLALSEWTPMSRYMLSRDSRRVNLRPKAELRALIAVAALTDFEQWGLAAINAAEEVERTAKWLGGKLPPVELGRKEPLTLERLMAGIREGVDIVYLVCHGSLPEGKEAFLLLQDEKGEGAMVLASELARRISELQVDLPRLIVMASCESAGKEGSAQAQHSLAPRLAEAGVPAVVAMQGQISLKTVELAMPVFFRELRRDGQIDRAMAVARGEVRDRSDAWMPTLFSRLKSGRIWYEPGFVGGDEFEKWVTICAQVEKGEFIPILGPELGEDLFGGSRELASRLAKRHAFPLEEHERYDLSKVAQYLSATQNRKYPPEAVKEQFLRDVAGWLGIIENATPLPLSELLDRVVERCGEGHPYKLLAELPASVYVNADYTGLMARFLRASEGRKSPETVLTCWRADPGVAEGKNLRPARVASVPRPKNAIPTMDKPWVYHMFGSFADPEMMVLTEDDFFDYLIASKNLLLPSLVGRLNQSSLLFLGFRLDDWRFRVLLRMIVSSEGTKTTEGLSHVGVQVNPDEQSLGDVKRARKYLEDYCRGQGDGPPLSIYWGSAEDFLAELQKQRARRAGETVKVTEESPDDWT